MVRLDARCHAGKQAWHCWIDSLVEDSHGVAKFEFVIVFVLHWGPENAHLRPEKRMVR